MADDRIDLKPEDRADDDADLAVAVTFDALGDIESDVHAMNGFASEARQAVKEALGRTDNPAIRRLLHRAQRANDDVIRRGLDVVKRTRSL